MKCKGVLSTELRIGINLVDVEDDKHEFRFRLKDEEQYQAYRRILESGAILTIQMQKDDGEKIIPGDYPEDCIKQDWQGYCHERGKLMVIPCRKRSCPDYLPPQRPDESEGW
jgi:hypothetical protein